MKKKSNFIRDAINEGRLVVREKTSKRRAGRPKMPEGSAITSVERLTLTKKERASLEIAMVKGCFPSIPSLLRYIVSSYIRNAKEPELKVIAEAWDWDRQEKDDKNRTNILKQGNLLEPISE